MVVGKQIYKRPLLLMLVAFIVASVAVSCGSNPEIDRQLTKAEEIMEQHPDSAYIIRKTKRATPPERNVPKIKRNVRLKQNEAYHRCAFLLQPLLSHFSKNFRPTSPGSVG